MTIFPYQVAWKADRDWQTSINSVFILKERNRKKLTMSLLILKVLEDKIEEIEVEKIKEARNSN